MVYNELMFNLKIKFFNLLKYFFGKHYYDLLLKLMHLKASTYKGYSLKSNIEYINKIINENNINSLLDYGCGKAMEYNHDLYIKNNLDIFLYDPYFSKYSRSPTSKYDLTVCTDVMEHVERNSLEKTLKNVEKFTKKIVFFSISTRLAKKNLPDGRNAHVTIMKEHEWCKILKDHIKKNIDIYVRFDDKKNVIKL